MALTNRENRQSAAHLATGYWTGTGVTVNSSKDREWRQEVGYGYGGISTDTLPPATLGTLGKVGDLALELKL